MRRRLEQLLKRYERGEVARVEWLDHLTLARIHQLRVQVAARPPAALPTHLLFLSRPGMYAEQACQLAVGSASPAAAGERVQEKNTRTGGRAGCMQGAAAVKGCGVRAGGGGRAARAAGPAGGADPNTINLAPNYAGSSRSCSRCTWLGLAGAEAAPDRVQR